MLCIDDVVISAISTPQLNEMRAKLEEIPCVDYDPLEYSAELHSQLERGIHGKTGRYLS